MSGTLLTVLDCTGRAKSLACGPRLVEYGLRPNGARDSPEGKEVTSCLLPGRSCAYRERCIGVAARHDAVTCW